MSKDGRQDWEKDLERIIQTARYSWDEYTCVDASDIASIEKAQSVIDQLRQRIAELEAALREIAYNSTHKPNWLERRGLILLARKALQED